MCADSFGDVAEDVAADVLVALGDAGVVSRPNREIKPGKFAFLEMLEYVGSRVKIVILGLCRKRGGSKSFSRRSSPAGVSVETRVPTGGARSLLRCRAVSGQEDGVPPRPGSGDLRRWGDRDAYRGRARG